MVGRIPSRLGDVRVVHQRQSLPLGLEADDHFPAIHPRFDDLQGHFAADRTRLLGHVDDTEAAFADSLKQFVRTDLRTDRFFRAIRSGVCRLRYAIQKGVTHPVRVEETFDPGTQSGVAAARIA